jgi:hypothetical protein
MEVDCGQPLPARLTTREPLPGRWVKPTGSLGVAVLLTLVLASCGGTGASQPSPTARRVRGGSLVEIIDGSWPAGPDPADNPGPCDRSCLTNAPVASLRRTRSPRASNSAASCPVALPISRIRPPFGSSSAIASRNARSAGGAAGGWCAAYRSAAASYDASVVVFSETSAARPATLENSLTGVDTCV